MKKLILSAALTSLVLASCGGGDDAEKDKEKEGVTICDCVNLEKEGREAEDRDKFREDNKKKFNDCKALGEKHMSEIRAIEDEAEREEARDEFMNKIKDCEE